MKQNIDVRIAQVGFTGTDIVSHLEKLESVIEQNRDADLLVFPELILQGHPSLEKPEGFLYRRARALYGQVSSRLYRFVAEQDTRVIIGQIRRKGDDLYNMATYADRDGQQHYTKCHVHWTENFIPGTKLRVFETPLGKVGINICFDGAFPEVWRIPTLLGARILVNISAVPENFPVEYMHRRLAGAALDNQVYVLYANRPRPGFSGGSGVFDPQGNMTAGAGAGESIISAHLDMEAVDLWRKEEKIFPHRRPELYRLLAKRAT
jgi:predicted amidohydrolase